MAARRRWQVRGWVRLAGVACIMVLVSQQVSTIYFVERGEMPASEVADGWFLIAAVTLLVVVMTFRPYKELRADGRLLLQGPLRKHTLEPQQVAEVRPTGWRLRFTLIDGSRKTSIVCQATRSRNEPRWFDVAEAVTGNRPVLEGDGFNWGNAADHREI